MNILYMGYFCNEKLFNDLVSAGSKGSHARQQLETKLINGMIAKKDKHSLELVSYLPYVSNYVGEIAEGENYLDIKIKYLWCNKNKISSVIKAMISNMRSIAKWSKNKQEKVVLTYSVNPLHVIPLFLLRRICHFEVLTLCSEVSVFRRTENVSLAGRISRKISSILDNGFDGYIFLSPYMNEVVNLKNRPFIVMEGIADEECDYGQVEKKRAILYAGGLVEDNGIGILLEGFASCGRSDIELWICGEGTMENIVCDYVDKYSNIKYYGILPNETVQQMEREAMLLVSPRFSKNEFTKYSFPSKTIEYMSSGTPTVLTRLAGIPEEYFKYAYVLEDETSYGMEMLIKEVLQQSDQERAKLGTSAKKFVQCTKNPLAQAERVFSFMQEFV